MCDLVLFVFLEDTNSSFSYNCEVPFQYLKIFVTSCCSTLLFVGSQFVSLNTLAPTWCFELSENEYICFD